MPWWLALKQWMNRKPNIKSQLHSVNAEWTVALKFFIAAATDKVRFKISFDEGPAATAQSTPLFTEDGKLGYQQRHAPAFIRTIQGNGWRNEPNDNGPDSDWILLTPQDFLYLYHGTSWKNYKAMMHSGWFLPECRLSFQRNSRAHVYFCTATSDLGHEINPEAEEYLYPYRNPAVNRSFYDNKKCDVWIEFSVAHMIAQKYQALLHPSDACCGILELCRDLGMHEPCARPFSVRSVTTRIASAELDVQRMGSDKTDDLLSPS